MLDKQKGWLSTYQEQLQRSQLFNPILEVVNNQPEGYTSIIMPHMDRGSLADLLSNVSTLNERALKELAVQILRALKEVHLKTQKAYSSLSPKQILFDSDGNVKLSLGLSNRLGYFDEFKSTLKQIKSHFSSKQRLRSPQVARTTFSLETNCASQQPQDNTHIDDVFDFGVLLLLCAVGLELPLLNKEH